MKYNITLVCFCSFPADVPQLNFQFFLGILPSGFSAICRILKNRSATEDDNRFGLLFADRVLLTFMRLRHAFGYYDLGYRFGITDRSASNACSQMLPELHKLVFLDLVQSKVPSLAACQRSKPPCLKDFPNVRFIIDCSEFSII